MPFPFVEGAFHVGLDRPRLFGEAHAIGSPVRFVLVPHREAVRDEFVDGAFDGSLVDPDVPRQFLLAPTISMEKR